MKELTHKKMVSDGGKKILQKYGKEYFREIGSRGGKNGKGKPKPGSGRRREGEPIEQLEEKLGLPKRV